jgi:hypothetical protein
MRGQKQAQIMRMKNEAFERPLCILFHTHPCRASAPGVAGESQRKDRRKQKGGLRNVQAQYD